jgi:DNA-binding GntR family transcriptional regulator
MLESYAASLAATNISDVQIVELKSLEAAMEQAACDPTRVQFKKISVLNNQFHKIILDASGNRRLVTLMSGLIEMAVILRTYHRYSLSELERSFGHHREIIAAFEAHDGEWASSVMTSHILAARASYLRRNKAVATGKRIKDD